MKIDIRKRDIQFFAIGLLTAVVIDFAWNWNQHIKAMKDWVGDNYNLIEMGK